MKYQCPKCETIFENKKYLTEYEGMNTCPICETIEEVYEISNQVVRLVMPTEAELLPCPFCGDEAEIQVRGTKNNSMVIACLNCGARVESPDIYGVTDPKYYHWNMRASS